MLYDQKKYGFISTLNTENHHSTFYQVKWVLGVEPFETDKKANNVF